jgi:ABC-type amino acid transport substrate-binding protein
MMDEHRIERALRQGPPDEPSYEPSASRQIAADRGSATGPEPVFAGGVRRVDVDVRPRLGPGRLRLAGPVAAAFVLLLVAVGSRFSGGLGENPASTPSDLLARIQSAGVVRIAVTSGAPQTAAGGGSYIGFDIDVARAVAEQLGVRDDVSAIPTAEILGGDGAWELAFPSRVLQADGTGLSVSVPYYGWPSWLVVANGSDVTDVAQLPGLPICVVSGTAGADWLAGTRDPDVGTSVDPPAGSAALERSTDVGCFEAIAAGDASAAVTATLLDDELNTRGVRPVGTDPILVERRSVLIRGTGQNVANLVEAVDRAIAELQSTGRLAELSRAAFGGRDLSEPAP